MAGEAKKKDLNPSQYDALIRSTQRDQLAVASAIVGFLLFLVVGMWTRTTGLSIYTLVCSGTILFGTVGWIVGQVIIMSAPQNRPVFMGGGEGEAEGITSIREVPVREAKPGMRLAAAATGMGGSEMLPAGKQLSAQDIQMLREQHVDMVLIEVSRA